MAFTYAPLLAKQRADVADGLFAATRRLRYSPERLVYERQRRLRELLQTAAERPYYAKRLAAAGIDPVTATEADLRYLEPTTKPEMMARFDDIIHPSLRLHDVETHLLHLDGDAYLNGEYRTLATGGSSGVRGIFVYGWRDWVEFMLLQMRWNVCRDVPPGTVGSTFTNQGQHVSGALHAFFAGDSVPVCHVPATMPLSEIVAAFNAAQPIRLQGYPTSIRLLAHEAITGRLHIRPTEIRTCGEQLTDDVRRAVSAAWDLPIDDMWGCSEGIYAYSCEAGVGMHLPDDLVIVEPVDDCGEPVPPGRPAAKIYITNLYNHTQPLIRYEITDAMTLLDEPCSCGCACSRIADIRGHADEVFEYGDGVVVQPIALYSVLDAPPEITEFQAIQTPRGVNVKVRSDTPFETGPLRDALADVMVKSGLVDPQVTVLPVPAMDRLWSGKLRRFVTIA